MDNIAVEAYWLSCLLPLAALLLLTFQFCSRSPIAKHSHLAPLHCLEEFPCHLGALITIADEVPSKHSHLTAATTMSTKSSKICSQEDEECIENGTSSMAREGSFINRWVLEGCNAGLSRMISINRLYFASRKDQIAAKTPREHRKKKVYACSRDWF